MWTLAGVLFGGVVFLVVGHVLGLSDNANRSTFEQVLTSLVGMVGTVLGYYFGSTGKTSGR